MTALFIILILAFIVFITVRVVSQKLTKDEAKPIEPIKPTKPNNPNAEVQELKFFCVKDKGYHVSVWPKDKAEYDIINFNIAGVAHHQSVAMKHLGETMGFIAEEPDNPYDENAIKVVTPTFETVGYVPRDMTAEIRKHTKLPCPCPFYIGYYEDDNGTHYYTDAYIDKNYTNK